MRSTLVAMGADDAGEGRLEVDVVRMPRLHGPQLEVRFDTGALITTTAYKKTGEAWERFTE